MSCLRHRCLDFPVGSTASIAPWTKRQKKISGPQSLAAEPLGDPTCVESTAKVPLGIDAAKARKAPKSSLKCYKGS